MYIQHFHSHRLAFKINNNSNIIYFLNLKDIFSQQNHNISTKLKSKFNYEN